MASIISEHREIPMNTGPIVDGFFFGVVGDPCKKHTLNNFFKIVGRTRQGRFHRVDVLVLLPIRFLDKYLLCSER